jgi:hypothetical protein
MSHDDEARVGGQRLCCFRPKDVHARLSVEDSNESLITIRGSTWGLSVAAYQIHKESRGRSPFIRSPF